VNIHYTYLGIQTYLGIYPQKKNKFSSELLKGPAGIAFPSGGDAY